MMQKVKCLMPSLRWVTHSRIIQQDVFATSMNLGKFSIWNGMCESLSFCTNQLGRFNNCNVNTHENNMTYVNQNVDKFQHRQYTWQAQNLNIT
jgi:hypothetical protein